MSITRASCSLMPARTESRARRRLAAVATTPCLSSAPRASSNWGLTISGGFTGGSCGCQQWGQQEAQGDEGHVGNDQVDLRHVRVVELAEVEAFPDMDTRVLAESGIELVVSDVDGPDSPLRRGGAGLA